MTKKKIDIDDLIDTIVSAKKKRPLNWIDRLDTEAKEFVFKLRTKFEEGVTISPARVVEKLEEHFGVQVSGIQVRRFLSGELHAEENFEEESSRRTS